MTVLCRRLHRRQFVGCSVSLGTLQQPVPEPAPQRQPLPTKSQEAQATAACILLHVLLMGYKDDGRIRVLQVCGLSQMSGCIVC